MPPDPLKAALVDFAVDVLLGVMNRLRPALDAHLGELLRKALEGRDVEAMPAPAPPRPAPPEGPRARYASLKQLGEHIGTKPEAVRKMLARKPPPPGVLIKMGRWIRVDLPAFERWMSSHGTA